MSIRTTITKSIAALTLVGILLGAGAGTAGAALPKLQPLYDRVIVR